MKKLLIPAIVLIALVAYIKLFELPKMEHEELEKQLFGSFSWSELERITLTKPNSTITFVNREPKKEVAHDPAEGVDLGEESLATHATTTWGLEQAPGALLDRAKIEGLATSIAQLRSDKHIEQQDLEPNMELYGLVSPELVLTIRVQGKEEVVEFGKKSDFLEARYAKVRSRDGLYLVDDTLFELATEPPSEYRDKTPITFSDDEVKSMVLQSGDKQLAIEPTAERTFHVTQPQKVLAQNYAVFDIYRNLRNLQAEEFIDAPAALDTYGLQAPKATITIHRATGPIAVTVGTKDDKEYFQVNQQGPVYKAVGRPLTGLSVEVETFREAQQFKFDHLTATKALVEKAGSPYLVVTKEQDLYQYNSEKADQPFAKEYLRNISEIRASQFLPLEDPVLKAKPAVRVVVSTDDGQKKKDLVLLIGDKRGSAYPAFVEGLGEPFMITEETYQVLVPALEKFKPVVESK